MTFENPYRAADPELYEQVRPGYPAESIAQLLGSQPSVIADIGAGTGTLTRQLLEADKSVTLLAVEPSVSMRKTWRPRPRVSLFGGSSEKTGLPDGSADLVVWAQSFHWVDRERTAKELARILRLGGRAAVLVNQMDVTEPWVHRLTRIMRSGDVIRRSWNPELRGFRTSGPMVFKWEQELTPEQVLGLARTRSSYLESPPKNRARMQENLSWYLFEHLGFQPGEELAVPYLTYLWWLDPGSSAPGASAAGV